MFFRKKISFKEFVLRNLRGFPLVNLSQSHTPHRVGTCASVLKLVLGGEKSREACRIYLDATHPPTCNHPVAHVNNMTDSITNTKLCTTKLFNRSDLKGLTFSSKKDHIVTSIANNFLKMKN